MDEIELRLRLERIELLLNKILDRQVVRDWYSVEQFAAAVGLSEYSIREYARLGRLVASKKDSGRGAHCGWVLSNDELVRFQRDGLLPLREVPPKG